MTSLLWLAWLVSCSELRVADVLEVESGTALPALPADNAADTPDAAGQDAGVPRVNLDLVDENLPKTTYRGVHVVSKDRVIIVGDEAVVELDGSKWSVTTFGGIDIYGVWANESEAWAVGVVKQSSRGAILKKINGRWIWLTTTEFGLHSVFGIGKYRFAAGDNGAVYHGEMPEPFASGTQIVPASEDPNLERYPLISSIGGNSGKHIVLAGQLGGFFLYEDGRFPLMKTSTDSSRDFRTVFAPPGDSYDVLLGANYYGVWRFSGSKDDAGAPKPMLMLNEDRSSPVRAAQYVLGIWGPNNDDVVAVGTSGYLARIRPGPPSPAFATRGGANDLRAVSGTSMRDVWVVGDEGTVLHGSLE